MPKKPHFVAKKIPHFAGFPTPGDPPIFKHSLDLSLFFDAGAKFSRLSEATNGF